WLKAEVDEESAQVLECRAVYPRRAERRVGAGRRIQHPARHHDDHAGSRFDETQARPGPDLAVMQPQAPAVQRGPAIMNLDFNPDTGRMNGRWLSEGRIISLRAAMAAVIDGPCCV